MEIQHRNVKDCRRSLQSIKPGQEMHLKKSPCDLLWKVLGRSFATASLGSSMLSAEERVCRLC